MSNRKINICIIAEYLSYVGGGERVYISWANMFTEILGYNVTIAAMEDCDKTFYRVSNKVNIHSLKLRKYQFYNNSFDRRLSMITNFAHDRKVIEEYINKHQFDVIIGIATNINLILSTINFSAGKIATEHTEYYAPPIFIRAIRKILYKNFDIVTALNTDDVNLFKKINPNTTIAINPVELNTIYKSSELTHKTIISIGSLSPQKNQKQMIDIMKLVHEKYPDWNLIIYGDGPLRDELKHYLQLNSCESFIKLAGVTNDVYSKLANSSIFILTSKVEGFGLVIAEAMSVGLPCVCFDALGPKMLIKHGVNGYLISMGNCDDFCNRICELIENFELRRSMGHNAYIHSKNYSIDHVAKQWSELIESTIKEKN